jgi:MerR family transcriptional regulator, light-induced transcriptional regulator
LPTSPAATDDVSVPGKPGADLDPDPPEARLTVATVARRLGVAPATLRTWDRRYGLGPTLHSAGAHRRYSKSDIARLEAMRRLVLDGVPPSDAARIAVESVPTARDSQDSPPPGPSGRLGVLDPPADGRAAGGPGGRVLALPGGSGEVRGLARAAMALDSRTLRTALDRALAEHGVIPTWTELLLPVLIAVGERWAATGEGIEVEHLLAETATGALRAVDTGAPEPRNGRPVLLACAPEETHSLPLAALGAALAEHGIGVRLLGGGLPAAALSAAVRRTGPAVLVVWAQLPQHADTEVLDGLPVLRPPVAVLAGGAGWRGRRLPARVTYVPDLATAVGLVTRAVGG